MNPVPRWFANEIAVLYDCFPGSKLTETVPISWWRLLGELPDWAIRKALAQAPKEAAQGQYLPSCENVRRLAQVFAAHPPVAHPPYRAQLTDGILAGSLPESNRFMRLARGWERESAELGLDSDAPAPREIGLRRAAELNALLMGGFGQGAVGETMAQERTETRLDAAQTDGSGST